jgi:tetratricopeptide (TPR) repeat protein
MGNYEQAEPLYQRAVGLFERVLGLEHPLVAFPLSGLARLRREMGKAEEAVSLYQRALSIREQSRGPHHPETAQTLAGLALLRQQQGQLDEACSLAERALAIRLKSLGETHPCTVASRTLHTQLVQEQRHSAEEEPASGHPSDPQVMTRGQEHLPTHIMRVAVRGTTGQVAYTRMVRTREVTFTCTICGQTVTQLHYPSGRIKYCSEACRAIRATQRHEVRVAKQRGDGACEHPAPG